MMTPVAEYRISNEVINGEDGFVTQLNTAWPADVVGGRRIVPKDRFFPGIPRPP
jgi:hypothetical protein